MFALAKSKHKNFDLILDNLQFFNKFISSSAFLTLEMQLFQCIERTQYLFIFAQFLN